MERVNGTVCDVQAKMLLLSELGMLKNRDHELRNALECCSSGAGQRILAIATASMYHLALLL